MIAHPVGTLCVSITNDVCFRPFQYKIEKREESEEEDDEDDDDDDFGMNKKKQEEEVDPMMSKHDLREGTCRCVNLGLSPA